MFTSEERGEIRDELVGAARADGRVSGHALFGPGGDDQWAGINLALGVDTAVDSVLADWTARVYDDYEGIDHLDVRRGYTRHRIFLTRSTLEIDLAFAPTAMSITPVPEPPVPNGRDPVELVRIGWLHALGARAALSRRQWSDADRMIAGVHEAVLTLACVRYGIEHPEDLPRVAMAFIEPAVPASVTEPDLRRAQVAAVMALRQEVGFGDRERAIRLLDPIVTLAR